MKKILLVILFALSFSVLLGYSNVFADMVSSTLYALGQFGSLYTVDKTTGTETFIGSSSVVLQDIAFDRDGTLYALGQFGSLYTVDKTTGTETFIGSPSVALTSIAFDETGTLYAKNAFASIYTVDKTTGTETFIGSPSVVLQDIAFDIMITEIPVGGESFPVDNVSLILASSIINSYWIAPLAIGIAVVVYLFKSKWKKSEN